MEIKNKKVLIHLHLFYENQTNFFINKLKNIIDCDAELFITFIDINEINKNKFKNLFDSVHFIKVDNLGYDVWPFLQVINSVNLDNYDYILKLHTKGSRKKRFTFQNDFSPKGYEWRNELVNSLIGSKKCFKRNLEILNDKNIGIIYSKLLQWTIKNDWPEETYLLDEMIKRLNIKTRYRKFCAGTMFLARSSIYKTLQNKFSDTDFVAYNESCSKGTNAHVLERILSILPDEYGFKTYIVENKFFYIVNRIYKFKKLILENIFSLKNDKSKMHKNLIILGFHFKIKKRRKDNAI